MCQDIGLYFKGFAFRRLSHVSKNRVVWGNNGKGNINIPLPSGYDAQAFYDKLTSIPGFGDTFGSTVTVSANLDSDLANTFRLELRDAIYQGENGTILIYWADEGNEVAIFVNLPVNKVDHMLRYKQIIVPATAPQATNTP